MKFKVDENLPIEVGEILTDAGHDARTVTDEELTGAADPKLAEVARKEERALVTLDLDFADIRVYPPQEYPGIIVLRLKRQDRPHVLEVCRRLLTVLKEEPLTERLWIVEEDRIRIRGSEASDVGAAT